MSNLPVMQIVLVAVLLGGALLYRRWMTKRIRASFEGTEGRASMLRFFESTGYRNRSLPDGDAAAQADEYQRRLTQMWATSRTGAGRFEGEMTRELDGRTVWYRFGVGGTEPAMGEWSVPLASPPRLRWRAFAPVDAKGGHGEGDGMRRVAVDDPELARRVRIEALPSDEAAVRALLEAPGLKEALCAFTYVDLEVDAHAVTFRDPMNRNAYAAVGGYFGAMLSAGNVAKTLEVSAPVHDNIADLLVRAARASAA